MSLSRESGTQGEPLCIMLFQMIPIPKASEQSTAHPALSVSVLSEVTDSTSGPGAPALRVMLVLEDLEPSGQGTRVTLRGEVMLMLGSQMPHSLIQEGNQPVL